MTIVCWWVTKGGPVLLIFLTIRKRGVLSNREKGKLYLDRGGGGEKVWILVYSSASLGGERRGKYSHILQEIIVFLMTKREFGRDYQHRGKKKKERGGKKGIFPTF